MPETFLTLLGNIGAIFLVILFFGGSIFVHELGHFLAARRRGVHVSRFSIGFGPKIFSWKGKDGVEYRVSWLPLGGYVALPQLADMRGIEGEADVDTAKLPPITYSTRMIVFAAGAFFNIIFAFLLASILWSIGRPVSADQASVRIGRVAAKLELNDKTLVNSPASVAGLKAGDKILAVDGSPISDFMEFQHAVISSTGVDPQGNRILDITIERDGKSQTLRVNPVRAGEENFRKVGVEPEYDVYVAGILPGSGAEKLGLREGDKIMEVNGRLIRSGGTLAELLQEATPTVPYKVIVLRDGRPTTLETAPNLALLTQFTGMSYQSQWSLVYHNPIQQFRSAVKMTVETLVGLLHPRGDISLSNMSGPIGIGRGFWAAAKSDYPLRFGLWFAILVNINLAIFNLLPIPVLDGGHMLFATIARLRRRPLPENLVMTTQSVFMVLLFTMIIYVSFFDSRRWVRDARQDREAERDREAATSPAK